MRVLVVILVAIVLFWTFFSNPARDIAGWLYPNGAAPWEDIAGYFYPNRGDLSVSVTKIGFNNLNECRNWAHETAEKYGDPNIQLGDYECGIGSLQDRFGFNVYRITVR